jgi:hypothetical protein
MNIPLTEKALLIRTDFTDQDGWEKLTATVSQPADPFIFNMEIVDDRANSGATVKQLIAALPEGYPHSFMVVADGDAMSQPDYPVVVADLLGGQFRAIAAVIALIDNNLSISKMSFEDFSEHVDDSGVFRHIP